MTMFSWRRAKTYRSAPINARHIPILNAAQSRVAGFDLEALQSNRIVMVGAGGIGSPAASLLIRKGAGHLSFVDDDRVELGNLSRQMFNRADVGDLKAHALARRLAAEGLFPARIDAVPFRFGEALERGHDFTDAAVIIAGVDNNPSRKAIAEFGIANNIPVIHAAVSRGGNESYVFVQEPHAACWACVFPGYVDDTSVPCNLPGIADSLAVVAGQIVYAVDSILADRPRRWNVRESFLCGTLNDRARRVERRADCPLCGHQTVGAHDAQPA